MSGGLKLKQKQDGDFDVCKEEPELNCFVICDYILDDWICGHDNKSVWDHYRDTGWCPLRKWYVDHKAAEFFGRKPWHSLSMKKT